MSGEEDDDDDDDANPNPGAEKHTIIEHCGQTLSVKNKLELLEMDMIQFARASMTADSIAFSMPALRTLLEESTAHYMGTLTKDDYGDFRVEDDTLHLGYDSPIRMELTIAMQNQKLSEHNRISFLTTEFETRFGWTPPMGRGVTRKPEAYLFPAFDAATKINLDLKTEFQEGFNYYEYATELEDVASTPRRRSYDPRTMPVPTRRSNSLIDADLLDALLSCAAQEKPAKKKRRGENPTLRIAAIALAKQKALDELFKAKEA